MILKKITPNFFSKACLIGGLLFNYAHAEVYIGSDLNSVASSNPTIAAIYSANRGTNGGGDQSMQFGDIVTGGGNNDLLIGGLGIDVLFGYDGDDIIIGGTEDLMALTETAHLVAKAMIALFGHQVMATISSMAAQASMSYS